MVFDRCKNQFFLFKNFALGPIIRPKFSHYVTALVQHKSNSRRLSFTGFHEPSEKKHGAVYGSPSPFLKILKRLKPSET